jgi:hypothetical protein
MPDVFTNDCLDRIMKKTEKSLNNTQFSKGTTLARFGLILFNGFRGEDLNMKSYNKRQTQSYGKTTHGINKTTEID